jgi:ribonuclease E
MLENEPNSGADGTAGTTETTDANEARPLTMAAPQTGEVKVSAPAKRSGGVRSAGPPPEPEPVVTDSGKPLTTIAGDVEAQPKPEVSGPADEEEGAKRVESTRAAKAPRTRVRTARTEDEPEDEPAAEESAPTDQAGTTGRPGTENTRIFGDAREEAPENRESSVSGAVQPPMVLFLPPGAQATTSGAARSSVRRSSHVAITSRRLLQLSASTRLVRRGPAPPRWWVATADGSYQARHPSSRARQSSSTSSK